MVRAKFIIFGALAALLAMSSNADAGRRGPSGILGALTAPLRMMVGMPRAVFGDPADNNRFSSRWVEGAGFFRLNTWQLGYSLSNDLLSRTKVLSRVRIFIGGQNNMLITNWSTLDPVNDRFPLPKSYFFGLNATL